MKIIQLLTLFNENYSVIDIVQWKVYSVIGVSSLRDVNSWALLTLILNYPEKLIYKRATRKNET